jgi:hypothetical protein
MGLQHTQEALENVYGDLISGQKPQLLFQGCFQKSGPETEKPARL